MKSQSKAHALTTAALERERVAKRKFERAKTTCMISEEKVKKLTIALVVLGVMFLVLLILSTRIGEIKIMQMCLPQWDVYVCNNYKLYYYKRICMLIILFASQFMICM